MSVQNTPSTPSKTEVSILERLENRLIRANGFLENRDLTLSTVRRWNFRVRNQIEKIYGENSDVMDMIPTIERNSSESPHDLLSKLTVQTTTFIETVKQAGQQFEKSSIGKVFIGHGHSPMWRELKDFLYDRLHLDWDEFNREAIAGIPSFERISSMLNEAIFAFLIMTAEDEHMDKSLHARENVVHEVGLFQGKLGPRKAIILLEGDCQEFSNVHGLGQIRFPEGHISATFEDIRKVLEREGIITTYKEN